MATAAGGDDATLTTEVPLALRRFGTPNPYLERMMRRRGAGAQSPQHTPIKGGGADDIGMVRIDRSTPRARIIHPIKYRSRSDHTIHPFKQGLPPLGPSPPSSPTAVAAAHATAASSASAGLPPPWLRKDDREVLRYFCYLFEAVHEGGNAGQAAVRVRRFTTCYFTASEAFTVEEPREPNSGIPQGTFLRKQRVPKPAWACRASPVVPVSSLKQQADGQQYLGPEDVEIGRALNFYGRCVAVA